MARVSGEGHWTLAESWNVVMFYYVVVVNNDVLIIFIILLILYKTIITPLSTINDGVV